MAPRLWGAAGVRGGARGWNADQFGRQSRCRSQYGGPFGGRGDRGGARGSVVGTLLGPEGADPPEVRGGRLSRVGAVRVPAPPIRRRSCAGTPAGGGSAGGGGGGGRVGVENCTVDASIFCLF